MGWIWRGVNSGNNNNRFFTHRLLVLHANQLNYDLTLQKSNVLVYQTRVWNKTCGNLRLSSSCIQGLCVGLRHCLLKLSECNLIRTVSVTWWISKRIRGDNTLCHLHVTAWAVCLIRHDKSSMVSTTDALFPRIHHLLTSSGYLLLVEFLCLTIFAA